MTKQEIGHGTKLHTESPLVCTPASTEWRRASQWSINRTRKRLTS